MGVTDCQIGCEEEDEEEVRDQDIICLKLGQDANSAEELLAAISLEGDDDEER